MKLHVFCFGLPQPDACFIKAYPAIRPKPFSTAMSRHLRPDLVEGFGGVPISILYDNLKIAVARILDVKAGI
jgi:transposase